jgi:hypothetical protein
VDGDLRGIAEAVQQVCGASQRVADMEQPGDQRGGPCQRPPLILAPAPSGRAALERGPQPRELRLIQLAHRPTRAFRRQRGLTPSAPAPPSLIGRLGAHPQPVRHLHRADIVLIHLRGLQPHALTPGPPSSGQATTIWIPS